MAKNSKKPLATRRLFSEQLEDRRLMTVSSLPMFDAYHPEAQQLYGPMQLSTWDSSSDDDRSTRIVDGTRTNDFPAVGILGDLQGGHCTGTLISPTHVLTAAHCAEGIADRNGSFAVGGRTYLTERIFVHPGYNSRTLANDIAIYQLREPVAGISPETIFRQVPVVGQMLTLVGFGAGGTGSTGHDNGFGTKRVGQTPIDAVTATEIQWTFERGESNTAPGDSGGPAFVTVNGTRYLAGVTSYGTNDDSRWGDQSGDTRVDAYKQWIDSIVGSTGGGSDDHGNTIANATNLTLNSNGAVNLTGAIEAALDRDMFSVTLAAPGSVMVALNSSDGSVDTYLRLYDASGNLIAENDDIGTTTNSRVTTNLPAGKFYFSASAKTNNDTGNYRVRVRTTAPTGGVTQIVLNSQGQGQVDSRLVANAVSKFSVTAIASSAMTIRTEALSNNVDTVLRVLDSNGRVVAQNDDSGGSLNSRVNFQAVKGQTYTIEVTEYDSAAGDFRLIVNNRVESSARSAKSLVVRNPADSLNNFWARFGSELG